MAFTCGQRNTTKKKRERERRMDGRRVSGSERKQWAIQGQAICLCKTDRKAVIRELRRRSREEGGERVVENDANAVSGDENKDLIKV